MIDPVHPPPSAEDKQKKRVQKLRHRNMAAVTVPRIDVCSTVTLALYKLVVCRSSLPVCCRLPSNLLFKTSLRKVVVVYLRTRLNVDHRCEEI